MRAAPLAFFGDASFARTIREVSTITHHNDEAAAGALAVVLAMQRLSADSSAGREATPRQLVDVLPDTALSDNLASLASLPGEAPFEAAAAEVGTSGRTAESIALTLFIGTSPIAIETAIVAAIRAGGDADTIAAVAAQLRASAGEEIPGTWRPHLPVAEARGLTGELTEAARAGAPRRRRHWWSIFSR